MANKKYRHLEILKGQGGELGLIQSNACLHYGLEGQCITSEYNIWPGDRSDLVERVLGPMGLTVLDGKIIPVWEDGGDAA